MKYVEAAEKILRDAKEKGKNGMSPKEIVQAAIEKGYIKTSGKTPHASMSAALSEHVKKNGNASIFVRLAPATYTIRTDIEPKSKNIRDDDESKPTKKRMKYRRESKSMIKSSNQPKKHKLQKQKEERPKKKQKTTKKRTNGVPSNFIELTDVKNLGSKKVLQCPVFRPTEEEFKDFKKYIESIADQCASSGICKIIPPNGWRPTTHSTKQYDDYWSYEYYNEIYDFSKFEIQTPLKQVITGKRGVFQIIPEILPSMTVAEFEKLALKEEAELYYMSRDGIDELDKIFWKSLNHNPPIYGTDQRGSFFSDGVQWNINKLDSLLTQLKLDIPGVTSSYLYFGMWKSAFAWHVEDMNLYSINYLHFGKPKQWYSVPASHAEAFENLARQLFPNLDKSCHHFLKHKTTIINPNILLKNNIPVYSTIQEKNEFIITFPKVYHSGFNHGLNCAEATNFALNDWIPIAKEIKEYCVCEAKRCNWYFDMNQVEKAIKGEKFDDIVKFL